MEPVGAERLLLTQIAPGATRTAVSVSSRKLILKVPG